VRRSWASHHGSGALVNTSRLDSKAWFIALLLLGIFNFGLLG